MEAWVYIRSEANLWTVGHYDPSGKWHSESDHSNKDKAAQRVHWLNGGADETDSSSTDSDDLFDETCDDCESNGQNCPLHDGPEWR